MAFPTVSRKSNSQETTATTSHTVSLPSVVADQLLLMFLINVDDGTHTGDISSPPSGWDLVDEAEVSRGTMYIYKKVATGSEGSTIGYTTIDNCASSHIVFGISGWWGTQSSWQYDQANNGVTATPDPPSPVVSQMAADDHLWITVLGFADDISTLFLNYPSNYTENRERLTSYNATSTGGLAVCTEPANADDLDPAAWGWSGPIDCHTYSFVITPGNKGLIGGIDGKINIGDEEKDLVAGKINIGDVWRDLIVAKINIGDAWKDIGFGSEGEAVLEGTFYDRLAGFDLEGGVIYDFFTNLILTSGSVEYGVGGHVDDSDVDNTEVLYVFRDSSTRIGINLVSNTGIYATHDSVSTETVKVWIEHPR